MEAPDQSKCADWREYFSTDEGEKSKEYFVYFEIMRQNQAEKNPPRCARRLTRRSHNKNALRPKFGQMAIVRGTTSGFRTSREARLTMCVFTHPRGNGRTRLTLLANAFRQRLRRVIQAVVRAPSHQPGAL